MKYIVMLFSLLLFPINLQAEEAPPPVLEVIFIDTNGNNALYVELFKEFTAAYKKAGSTGVRKMWNGVYAGPNTGSVVTTVEFPSMEALVKSNNATFGSEAYQAVSAKFVEAGMGVESRSLMFGVP